ncbi:MAG TPA: hypothetical protein VHS28_06350 [Chloroflexota bacterium]|nr:hypothetical protein [Chloroflexota bacterium]
MVLTDSAQSLLSNEKMREHYLGGGAHVKEARQRRQQVRPGTAPA